MPNQLLLGPDNQLYSVPDDQVADAMDPSKGNYTKPPEDTKGLAVSPAGQLVKLSPEEESDALNPEKGNYKPYSEVVRHHQNVQSIIPRLGSDELIEEHENDNIFTGNTVTAAIGKQKTLALLDPNGEPTDMPINSASDLFAKGWKFQDPKAQELYDAMYQADKGNIVEGVLEAFATAIPGSKEIGQFAGKYLNSKDNSIHDLVRDRVAAEAPKWQKTVGGVIGTLPALIFGGEIGAVAGEATESAILAGKTAEEAAELAPIAKTAGTIVEGATFMAPQATVDYLNGHSKGAAEDIAIGAGINVFAHGLFGAIEKEVSPLTKEAIEDLEMQSKSAKAAAIEEASKAIGIKAAQAERIAPYMKQAIEKGIIKYGDSTAKTLENLAVSEAKDTKLISTLSELDKLPNKTSLIAGGVEKFINEAKILFANKPEVSSVIEHLKPVIDDPSFKGLQDAKLGLEKSVNWLAKNTDTTNQLKKTALNMFSNTQKGLETEAASQLGKPMLAKTLEEARGSAEIRKVLSEVAGKVPEDVSKMSWKDVAKAFVSRGEMSHIGLSYMANMIHPGLGHVLYGVTKTVSVGRKLSKLMNSSGVSLSQAVGRFNTADELVAKAMENRNTLIKRSVKSVFDSLGKDKIASGAAFISMRSAKDLLADNGVGKNHGQQLAMVRKNVSEMVSDPEHLNRHLAPVTDALKEAGLHQVAQSYTEHQIRLLKVLDTILPKGSDPMSVHPFSANVKIDEISPAAKTKYQRALTIALEPDKLLDMIKSNTITPYDVAICGAVNPETLQKMRNALVEESMKSKPNISYQQQLSLGIMMGTNLDEATQQLPVLQSIYPIPQPSVMPGKSGKKSLSDKKQEDLSGSYLTTSQKALHQ